MTASGYTPRGITTLPDNGLLASPDAQGVDECPRGITSCGRGHPRQPGDNAGSIARQTVCKWRSHRKRKFFVLSLPRGVAQRYLGGAGVVSAGPDPGAG